MVIIGKLVNYDYCALLYWYNLPLEAKQQSCMDVFLPRPIHFSVARPIQKYIILHKMYFYLVEYTTKTS